MSLVEPTLSNGQVIRLATLTGTVISASKASQTAVSQDAPIVLSAKTVIPGQIRSTTQTTQDLWLRMADGKEQAISLTDFDLPVREGHTVSVLWGGPAWSEGGSCFGARNHTTGDVRCDVMVLGHSLKEWRLSVGAGSSMALWTFGTALVLALPAFFVSGGGTENKAAMALGAAMLGGFVGLMAWVFVGSNIGPGRRAAALSNEISELGRKALMQA